MRTQWHTGVCVCVCVHAYAQKYTTLSFAQIVSWSWQPLPSDRVQYIQYVLGMLSFERFVEEAWIGTYTETSVSLIKEIYSQKPDKTKHNIIAKEILLSFTKNGQADIKRGAKSTDCCLWWRKKCSASVGETNYLHTRTHTHDLQRAHFPCWDELFWFEVQPCQRPCIVPSSEAYVPPPLPHTQTHV